VTGGFPPTTTTRLLLLGAGPMGVGMVETGGPEEHPAGSGTKQAYRKIGPSGPPPGHPAGSGTKQAYRKIVTRGFGFHRSK
jgi:hypothetical protein